MKPKFFLQIFFVVGAVNLLAQLIASEILNSYTKPLLMPILMFYVYRSSIGNTTLKTLLLSLALLLSWIGDISLMYQSESTYFLIGIGFFLLAQITYIIALKKTAYQLPLNIIWMIPIFLYGIVLLWLLLPNAGEFQAPVLLYGLVIMTMACVARLREGNTTQESFRLAFAGSVLFVISDSLIALNKFYFTIPYAGLFIMGTYIAAQYLLAQGIMKHVD